LANLASTKGRLECDFRELNNFGARYSFPKRKNILNNKYQPSKRNARFNLTHIQERNHKVIFIINVL